MPVAVNFDIAHPHIHAHTNVRNMEERVGAFKHPLAGKALVLGGF